VSEYINRRVTEYIKALEALKNTFQEFKYSAESKQAIYTIYSRREKQGGDEFKAAWKIAKKVNSARIDGNPKKGIPPNPNFAIQDISDMIGLTVVVVYPSHIETVKMFVETQRGRKFLVIDGEEKNERGYRAYHYVLGHTAPTYPGIRCEVQIKTILHDSWSAKTHDLTYKPQGVINSELLSQFESLSDALSVVDRQSESLKRQIEEIWYFDEKRRNAAKHALMRALTLRKTGSSGRQENYEKLVKDLLENEAKYQEGNVEEVVKRLHEFAQADCYDSHACRLFTLLATIRTKDDYDSLALDCIDRWVSRPLETEEKIRSLNFLGLAHFCFNHMREAIAASEDAVKIARECTNQNLLITTLLNTAYFLAELASSPDGEEGKRARELLEEAIRLSGNEDNLPPQRKDTLGLVKIVTGKTEAEVREGLKICETGLAENPDKVTGQAFFQLAEKRAFRRLLEFE
jgi:ppGpp synthetase/RelA/SpoT-type nucleotidyltranferase